MNYGALLKFTGSRGLQQLAEPKPRCPATWPKSVEEPLKMCHQRVHFHSSHTMVQLKAVWALYFTNNFITHSVFLYASPLRCYFLPKRSDSARPTPFFQLSHICKANEMFCSEKKEGAGVGFGGVERSGETEGE